jgi:hypothetical protein
MEVKNSGLASFYLGCLDESIISLFTIAMYSTSVVSHLFQEINLKLLENYLMKCSYADQLLER